jgi:DMSO/TMAO reductase YedYZ molybdopterin-dependent catalytic subunit
MEGNFKFTRREFLRWTGMGAVGLAFSGFLAACQQAVAPFTGGASNSAAKDIAQKGAPLVSAQKVVDGVPITSNEDFYTVWYSSGGVPAPPPDWKLKIAGLVDKPLEFSLDELRALPAVEEMRTLECISNPVGGELISNALWKGVRFKDLLAQAGVKSGAKEIKLESFDGYSTSIPVELGMHEHALLVYEMNGEPLPRNHGAPLRCLWPGRYGMKQPKWIRTITVLASEYRGHWEKQGWTNDAFILPNSRIESPTDLTVITTPTFALSGVAYSGEDGIEKIDIAWDDSNDWKPAELTRVASPYVWTIWKWAGASLSPGRHTLYARVTTKNGRQQSRGQTISFFGDTFPNGTDHMHSVVLDFKG